MSVWTGLMRASCSICPLLADLSGELPSSLQPLIFLLHSVSAPVSLFLFSSSPPPLWQKQPTALFPIVLQLSFLYKSFFSTSTCPCRRAQNVPSSCTAMRHCRSVHSVTDSSSVTHREGGTSSYWADHSDSISKPPSVDSQSRDFNRMMGQRGFDLHDPTENISHF